MKLEENKEQVQKKDTKKLRGLAFSLRPRAKTEGKYFTSTMRITSVVIF